MHKYDFIRRLKKIEQTEIIVCQKKVQVSKSSFKYLMQLKKVKDIIESERASRENRKRLQNLKQINTKLLLKLKTEKEELERNRNEIVKMQENAAEKTEKYLKDYQIQITNKIKLHTLQQTCDIFINTKSLPDLIQGMIIQESQQEKHWIPFRFATNDVESESIQELLWSMVENSSLYNQQWEYLVCGVSTAD